MMHGNAHGHEGKHRKHHGTDPDQGAAAGQGVAATGELLALAPQQTRDDEHEDGLFDIDTFEQTGTGSEQQKALSHHIRIVHTSQDAARQADQGHSGDDAENMRAFHRKQGYVSLHPGCPIRQRWKGCGDQ